MSKESLSVAETCLVLNVSRWTLWRLVRKGKLVAFKVGRAKRFHLADIRRFKSANAVKVDGAGWC